MSLFDEFQQWEIIENPNRLRMYRKIAPTRKWEEEIKQDKKKEWKELSKKMKQQLSPDEFVERRKKAYYQMMKKEYSKKSLERYYRNKEDEAAMLDDIYKELYDPLPEPINYNKYYEKLYNKDDRDWNGRFSFYWWASRLNRVHANLCDSIDYPVRVCDRRKFIELYASLWREQDKAYNYIYPHLDEIDIKDFFIAQEQFFTRRPMWITKRKMRELTEATDISKNQICNVASALLRDKYIVSELYLGRVSFLLGDVIITQGWNLFRPILENNLPRLTKDTVEELHKKRFAWLHRKNDDLPIYVLWDAYLIKIPINKWETYFYIVPT